MGKYKIAEKFVSINGEGRKAGQLSTFIRFVGCNLNCEYCDTKWANETKAPYEIMSEEEIYEYIVEAGVENVTITGGEPLIQENILRLLKLLSKDNNLYIEIETNGSVCIEPYVNLSERLTFTLDYKLSASKMEDRMIFDNYRLLRKYDTVKFVVANEYDLNKTREIIDKYLLDIGCGIYISPVFGEIEPSDIVEYMVNNKMNKVNAQLQLHKFIWDADKRGV